MSRYCLFARLGSMVNTTELFTKKHCSVTTVMSAEIPPFFNYSNTTVFHLHIHCPFPSNIAAFVTPISEKRTCQVYCRLYIAFPTGYKNGSRSSEPILSDPSPMCLQVKEKDTTFMSKIIKQKHNSKYYSNVRKTLQ